VLLMVFFIMALNFLMSFLLFLSFP
jgi:hypothetical protein